jgi:hypothetical protein
MEKKLTKETKERMQKERSQDKEMLKSEKQ